jgi:hypothetical protein
MERRFSMIAPVPCIYKAEIRQQPKPAFVCTSKKKEEKSFKNILDHAVKRGEEYSISIRI